MVAIVPHVNILPCFHCKLDEAGPVTQGTCLSSRPLPSAGPGLAGKSSAKVGNHSELAFLKHSFYFHFFFVFVFIHLLACF